MVPFRALVLLTSMMLLPGAAWADAPRGAALKKGAAVSIAAYGRQNPQCAEWTNGCVVCRTADGHAQCSTAGIACTPTGLQCRRRVTP